MIARPSHRIFALTWIVLLVYLGFDFWKDASTMFQSLHYDWNQKEEIAMVANVAIDTIGRDFLRIKKPQQVLEVRSGRTFSLQAKREHFFKTTTIVSADSTVTFSGLKWLNGRPDNLQALHNFKIYDLPLIQSGNFKLVTLGDSQMIWREGRELRKNIAKQSPHVRFIGKSSDVYGYPTDAATYDSANKILRKAKEISKAEGYLLFFGAQDKNKDPMRLKKSICQIFSEIRTIAPEAQIWYVSLPPSDKNKIMMHNQQFNELLKECANEFKNVELIDLFKSLRDDKDFLSADKVHLNTHGYDILTKLISKALAS